MFKNEYFETRNCPVCAAPAPAVRYPISLAYAQRRSGIDVDDARPGVGRCKDCGHLFIQPCPLPTFLTAFYTNYMSTAKSGFYQVQAEAEIAPEHRQRYGRWLARIKELAPESKSLLDIGAGMGMFLRLAREHGFEVAGIEPNPEAADKLANEYQAPIHSCLLEDYAGDERYDVVTMWDLLEHLADPGLALRQAHKLLHRGGLLVLEVPARDSLLHWLVRALWHCSAGIIRGPLFGVYGIHHLQYFSQASITAFVEQNSFSVCNSQRCETDLAAKGRRPGRSTIQRLKSSLKKVGLRLLFLAARLVGRQNKVIIFARSEAHAD